MSPRFILFIYVIVGATQLLYSNTYTVPKESYLTYSKFKQEQMLNEPTFRVTDEWIELSVVSPLLAKYQVNNDTVMSISSFTGSVGDDLANVNRWRRQLGLLPIKASEMTQFLTFETIGSMPMKVVQLDHNYQFLLLYWLTDNNQHFFVKIESQLEIEKSMFDRFVANQPWAEL
jgi:hypothetical protein